MKTERQQLLFQQYLSDALSEEEVQEFNREFEQDKEFRESVLSMRIALHRELVQANRIHHQRDYEREVAKKRKKLYWLLGILAASSVLGWFFINKNQPFSPTRVMAYHDEKIPVVAHYNTQGTINDSLKTFATLFNEKKYDEALSMNLVLKVDNPHFGTYQYYLGVCHLRKQVRDFESAEKCFLKAKETFLNPANPQPEWLSQTSLFLALTYAGKENWQACLEEAERVDTTMIYYRELEKLINTAKEQLKKPSN